MGAFKEYLICNGKKRQIKNFLADCWGCTTHFPFLPKIHELALLLAEVAPQDFLFHWKSTSQHLSCWGCTALLPFSLPNHMMRGQGYCLKGIPCAFSHTKGSHMEACKHIQPLITQLQCFIPLSSEISHCHHLDKYFVIGLGFTIPSVRQVLLGSSKPNAGSWLQDLPNLWPTGRVEQSQTGLPK